MFEWKRVDPYTTLLGHAFLDLNIPGTFPGSMSIMPILIPSCHRPFGAWMIKRRSLAPWDPSIPSSIGFPTNVKAPREINGRNAAGHNEKHHGF